MALPSTTIVPFTALPSCATLCGPLYDANGACVPPNVATAAVETYDSCFCAYSELAPFSSTTAGVCDSACTADAGGLSSIQSWFTSFCSGQTQAATTTGTSATSSSTSGSSSTGEGGGDWLSTHWKWVIMIVIVVVGIAGIWIGACIWRRKYLKKKDRMYELGKGLPSNMAVNTQGNLVGASASKRGSPQPGMFMSGPAPAAYTEKPKSERKRWNVTERT